MLQLTNGSIIEMPVSMATNAVTMDSTGLANNASYAIGGCYPLSYPNTYYTVWNSWPVYVCTDKTAKAIEILKTLQAEKKIRCDSVPKFIALVEKIAAIL